MASSIKTCLVTADDSKISCSVDILDCFTVHSHQYLEKSGTVFVPEAKTLSSCLQRCLFAEFDDGFDCETVMWKRNINGCILSRWKITERTSFLRKSDRVMVDMYENKCIAKHVKQKLKSTTLPPTTFRPIIVQPVLVKQKSKKDFPIIRTVPTKFLPYRIHKVSAFHLNGIVVDGESKKDALLHNKFPPPKAFQERNFDVSLAAQLDELASIRWNEPPVRKQQEIKRHNHPDEIESRKHRELPRDLVPPRREDTAQESHKIEIEKDRIPKAPCFVRIKGKMLENFVEKVFRSDSVTECLVKCLQTEQFYCASVNYNMNTKVCSLNGGSQMINKVTLKNSDFDYYENMCTAHGNKENTEPINRAAMQSCFEMKNNTVYVSFEGQIMSNIHNEEECKSECMKTLKMNCKALNWFRHTNQCLLFTEIKEHELTQSTNAVFYRNKCSNKKKERSRGSVSNDYYDTTN